MNGPSKQMLRRLTAAVEWRSWGVGWHVIGERLHTRPDVCRHWPDRYAEEWARLMCAAERRRWDELEREASIVLDGLLRSSDPKIRHRPQRIVTTNRLQKQPVTRSDGRVEELWVRR